MTTSTLTHLDPDAVTDHAHDLLTARDAPRVKHSTFCPGCEEDVLVGPMFADEAWAHAALCVDLRLLAAEGLRARVSEGGAK